MSLTDPQTRIAPRGVPRTRRSSGDVLDVTERIRSIDGGRPVEVADVAPVAQVVPATRSEQASRVLNVVVAAVALILLSPLLLLIALAVRLTSHGPILYMQTRVGLYRRQTLVNALYDRRMQDLGGRIFTIYKFRTMHADAEAGSGAVWASKGDPRVTTLGRFLRKTRLDELPQLFNVLTGDMNIVGPRPERPSIFARLRHDIREYPLRQLAKPGITGWAQINTDYDQSIEDVRRKVHYDLEYIRDQSLVHDLRIMARMVPVILFRRGGW